MWPASTTRVPRPRVVRATTLSPTRVTSNPSTAPELGLDPVGEPRLVEALRRQVDELGGEGEEVGHGARIRLVPPGPVRRRRAGPGVATPLTCSVHDEEDPVTPDAPAATPAARGVGLATFSTVGTGTKVLDTWYPILAVGAEADPAHAVLSAAGDDPVAGTTVVGADALRTAAAEGAPAAGLLEALADAAAHTDGGTGLPVRRALVVTTLADLDAAPVDAHDVYLRLQLLSSRRVAPHGLNLDGQFGLLSNVVWTDRGPADPEGFEEARAALRARGETVEVVGVDKFPAMTDYVIPSGVRIANTDRVRLGAHLAEGTTVMHEGFVNFNAGTLGPSMVEGRISAGVVVGPDSDVGGGASIQGTLSGGGKEVISLGSGCLLGANSGIGISLGDDCVVEAGLYVTAGTRVTLPTGEVVKARTLSGRSGLLFIRNSETGAVEARARTKAWGELNAELHAN